MTQPPSLFGAIRALAPPLSALAQVQEHDCWRQHWAGPGPTAGRRIETHAGLGCRPSTEKEYTMLEGRHYQNAYVTRDIDRAIQTFKARGRAHPNPVRQHHQGDHADRPARADVPARLHLGRQPPVRADLAGVRRWRHLPRCPARGRRARLPPHLHAGWTTETDSAPGLTGNRCPSCLRAAATRSSSSTSAPANFSGITSNTPG